MKSFKLIIFLVAGFSGAVYASDAEVPKVVVEASEQKTQVVNPVIIAQDSVADTQDSFFSDLLKNEEVVQALKTIESKLEKVESTDLFNKTFSSVENFVNNDDIEIHPYEQKSLNYDSAKIKTELSDWINQVAKQFNEIVKFDGSKIEEKNRSKTATSDVKNKKSNSAVPKEASKDNITLMLNYIDNNRSTVAIATTAIVAFIAGVVYVYQKDSKEKSKN